MKRMNRVLAALLGCVLALCMGITALAAETDTGEPMGAPSHAESGGHGTKEAAAVGGLAEFERNPGSSFSASTRFYLRIENSPYIGPSGGGGGGDSVRVLVPLDLPDNLKLIDDLPIPLSIPNTGDGPLPATAFALLAVSAALIAAAGYQSGGKSHRGREDRTPPKR